MNAPTPTDRPWHVVLGCCQYPAGILDSTPAHGTWSPGPADRVLAHIAALTVSPCPPGLLLLLGDQVYVDATAGLFDPVPDASAHSALYRARQEGPWALPRPGGTPRVEAMLDDHEILDNWVPIDRLATGLCHDGRQVNVQAHWNERLREGLAGYWQHQAAAGATPAPRTPLWRTVGRPGQADAVFLCDTRTERTLRNHRTVDSAKLMSDAQLDALCRWLTQAPHDKPCVLASPSMVLPRPRQVAQGGPAATRQCDAWPGYPATLNRLLAAMLDAQHPHLLLVSGDEHLASFTRLTVTDTHTQRSVTAHVVHTAALYAPYPFANAQPRDFCPQDTFTFTTGSGPSTRTYRCTTQSWFAAPGDGCVQLMLPPVVNAAQPMRVHFALCGAIQALPNWVNEVPTLQVSTGSIGHAPSP